MTTSAILCRDLTVAVGRATLLDRATLDVAPEEHVLLVGPSGSGKTTLLRAIAGLVVPASGTIELFGRRASSSGAVDVVPENRDVGYLFQGGALWPHLTVGGTLDFVLKRRSGGDRSERNERARELLDIVDLAGFEKRRVPTLSGGEAQRLSLARALAADPKILLLDEPLGPLDAPRREALLDRLAALTRRFGLTTVHVTHDPREADRIATRQIEIAEGGRIVAPTSAANDPDLRDPAAPGGL